MKLIFIHGMPGCGKLTVARELSRLTGFRLFHNHLTVDLAESLFEFGSEPFVKLRESIWLSTFRQAADAGLNGLIFTFAYDRTVGAGFIDRLLIEAAGNGVELHFVGLQCSAEELEQRLTNPSRKSFGKLTSLAQFRELNDGGAFVNPGIPDDGLFLDITTLGPNEVAKAIAEELKL